MEEYATLEEWIASRPASVQALAKRFPITTTVFHESRLYYLLGYTEPDGLWLTPIYPGEDYEGANAAKIHICGDCLDRLQPGTPETLGGMG